MAKAIRKPVVRKSLNYVLIFITVFVTALIYSHAVGNELTNWDDDQYVTENAHIKSLSKENLTYHFTHYHMGNYHPLAMISLSMDYKEPLSAKSFHLTSVILHLFNTVLVFLFVFYLTKNNTIGFIAGLLFALHPMHVESVAWVSERKDVLYAFFFLIALCIYTKNISSDKNKVRTYILVTLFFILSLLSKGQAVILPVVFLFIDYFSGRKMTSKVFIEKIPWLILSVVFGIVAIIAQKSAGFVQTAEAFPVSERMIFACYGVASYLYKLILPFDLSCFYPYPLRINGSLPVALYIMPFVLITIAFIVWKYFRTNKYVVFSCLLFLTAISLILQLIPVGSALIADRYTYIAYLGFFILAGKLFADAYERKMSGTARIVVLCLVPLSIIVFTGQTYARIGIWKDSLTLWNNAATDEQTSPKVFMNRGKIYEDKEQYDLAIKDFNKALGLKSDYAEALYDRGLAYFYLKNYDDAIKDFTASITINPALAVAWHNRAGTYFTMGRYKEALSDAIKAQELGFNVDPKFIEVLKQKVSGN